MESKIYRKGEHVLIDAGYIYPGYKAMAIQLNADIGGKWKLNRSVSKWQLARNEPAIFLNVISNNDRMGCCWYALIELTDVEEQYVIGLAGIKNDPEFFLPDELFEI